MTKFDKTSQMKLIKNRVIKFTNRKENNTNKD